MDITVDDLERLANEVSSEYDGPGWLSAKTNVTETAMGELLEDAASAVMDNACCQQHARIAVVEVVGTAFRLGWELRDQYGRKHDERSKTLCPVHEPGACPPGCEHALSFDDDS